MSGEIKELPIVKWEYKVLPLPTPFEVPILKNYGFDGWENYQILPANGKYYYYFKRPLTPTI